MERYRKVKSSKWGVFQAFDTETGQIVAAKKVWICHGSEDGISNLIVREISILRQLSHPNIIKLHNVEHVQNRLWMIYEWMEKDLRNVLEEHDGPLPAHVVKGIMIQLIRGVYYCHSYGVLHRDLKPGNIFFAADGTLRIADFGLARAVVPPIRTLSHDVVSLCYRAPEILLGCKSYGMSIDMWSLGCIFAEIITRSLLFPGDCEIHQLYKIFSLLGTPNEHVWPGCTSLPDWNLEFPQWHTRRLPEALSSSLLSEDADALDLLEMLLTMDPGQRITASEALELAYFHEAG